MGEGGGFPKCRNPSFGLATKAKGVVRVRAKRKPKSHIRDSWECRRMWGSGPSHSQGNSHFGRGSPGGLPKLQRPIWRVKTQWLVAFFISLESSWNVNVENGLALLIWTSETLVMAKRRGWESNCQFDSRPEKVKNRPDLLGFIQHATYRWKALDESYNFALDHTSIRGLLTKLWGSKVLGVPAGGISGLPRGSPAGVPGEKSHLDVGPMERCRVYYKGEGGGFPQVRVVVSLVCPCCSWLLLAPKVLQLCTNHFVWVVCRLVWVNKLVNSS